MCYDVSVLTQNSTDRAKPNHQSPLMFATSLQITAYSVTKVTLIPGLVVPLGVLMPGVLHVQRTKKLRKAQEQRSQNVYLSS